MINSNTHFSFMLSGFALYEPIQIDLDASNDVLSFIEEEHFSVISNDLIRPSRWNIVYSNLFNTSYQMKTIFSLPHQCFNKVRNPTLFKYVTFWVVDFQDNA